VTYLGNLVRGDLGISFNQPSADRRPSSARVSAPPRILGVQALLFALAVLDTARDHQRAEQNTRSTISVS